MCPICAPKTKNQNFAKYFYSLANNCKYLKKYRFLNFLVFKSFWSTSLLIDLSYMVFMLLLLVDKKKNWQSNLYWVENTEILNFLCVVYK